MGDEDLRDLFALGAMMGQIMREGILRHTAEKAYDMANDMLKERNRAYPTITPEEGGIAAVVKRTRKKHGEDS